MARTRYGTDRGLSARMVGTLFGIGLLYVVLAAVLIAIGVNAVFVLVISAGLLFGQWWFSDSMAMSAMRAVVVTPEQAPQLHAIVDRICAMADMPKPRVGHRRQRRAERLRHRADRRTARSSSSPPACCKRLDPEELEGVLAHELSHVAHRDVTVMAVASFTAILAGFLMRSAMWGSMGRNRDKQHRGRVHGRHARQRRRLLPVVHPHARAVALPRARRRPRRGPADRQALGAGPRAAEDLRARWPRIPTRDLRQMEPVSSFAFAPALSGGTGLQPRSRSCRRTRRWRSGSSSWRGSPPSSASASRWASSTPSSAARRPVGPNLDALFALPSAAITPAGQPRHACRPVAARSPSARPRAGRSPTSRPTCARLLDADGGPPVEMAVGRVRLHLAGRRDRPARPAGGGHRRARGQHVAGRGRLRTAAAVLAGLVPRSRRTARWRWSTCSSAAPSTRSRRRRPGHERAARQRAGAAGARPAGAGAADRGRPGRVVRRLGGPRGSRWAGRPLDVGSGTVSRGRGSARAGRACGRARPGPSGRCRGRPRCG